jgi:hypothetical protein
VTNLRNDDIDGSMAGSFRKGMTTTRCIHPLEKGYQYPGHSELETKDPYSKTKKEIKYEAMTKAR